MAFGGFKTIVGLDLGARLRTPKTGLAVIEVDDQWDAFSLVEVRPANGTAEILSLLSQVPRPVLLAIDAPLRLPFEEEHTEEELGRRESEWNMVYTYRPWEYLIFERLKKTYGVSGRPFSSLVLSHRGQVLRRLLQQNGWTLTSSPEQSTDLSFTEVFPNLTMGIIRAAHDKELEPEATGFVKTLLKGGCCGVRIDDNTGGKLDSYWRNADVVDAVICAWTGALLASGRSRSAICLGDDKYGFVICPYTEQFSSLLRQDPGLIYSHKIL